MKKEKALRGEVIPPLEVSEEVLRRSMEKAERSWLYTRFGLRFLVASILSYAALLGFDGGVVDRETFRPFEWLYIIPRTLLASGVILSLSGRFLEKQAEKECIKAGGDVEEFIKSEYARPVSKVAK